MIRHFFLSIAVLVFLHCPVAFGSHVLWFGIEQTSIVKNIDGSSRLLSSYDFNTEVNTVRISRFDSTMKFLGYLSIFYEDLSGNYVLDPDVVESDILNYDSTGFIDWSPASLGEVTSENETDRLVMELGFVDFSNWDEDDPSTWDTQFEKFAWSDSISIETIINAPYAYESFTLNPPIETPWRPSVFYTYADVPEPATTELLFFGIATLFRRRRK